MTGLNSFDSAALRLLQAKVEHWIKANTDNLAIGSSIIQGDVNATATSYCSAVAYVRALNDVLGLCQEVEDDLLGRNDKKPPQSTPYAS